MERLFSTHEIRQQECLDGIWDFQIVDKMERPDRYEDTMAVPSCWEMNVKYCRYTGFAAYRKKFSVKEKGNVRFVFKGVSHTCKVYFDGVEIGMHYNAYTPFSVIVPNAEAGEHVLEVLVDNRFSEESTLHIENDYFTYGGIIRPVFMEMVPDCFVERSEFEPVYENGCWMANVRIFVRNITTEPFKVSITIKCANQEKNIVGEIACQGDTMFSASMQFENIEPWSIKTPQLYLVHYVLKTEGKAVDDLIDRIGFRQISLKNKQVLINEEPVFIKGVNRHEDHGTTGCAIPLQIMYSDIALIKDLGANAVRTSHYPNDERFLDLCDENGILVWEESHDRGGDVERITNPLFVKQSMQVMQEMLEYHYNHPSIIMWGCLNEAASDTPEGREIFRLHLDYFAKDKSRPYTYASNRHVTDICLDLESICSFNMYPLWYDDKTTEWTLNRIREHVKNTGNDQKPLIISEYGGGAIYNFHDVMHVKWSEEYQADLMESVTRDLLNDDGIAGVFIWQFCDIRIKGARFQKTRPKERNNKGLVDEYRRPKAAYYVVKSLFENKRY